MRCAGRAAKSLAKGETMEAERQRAERLTKDEIKELRAFWKTRCLLEQSERDAKWNEICRKIKQKRQERYPPDWHSLVLSGALFECCELFVCE